MLDYREALGYSRRTHSSSLMSFDRFCAEQGADGISLEREHVQAWLYRELEKPHANIIEKATTVRLFGKYLAAIGRDAYVLPEGFVSTKKTFVPYVFTDSELRSLFSVMDRLPQSGGDRIDMIAPILFRLIYTCGLRPKEGRELEYANVNIITGEILLTKTKRKKERVIVMSDEMLSLYRHYDRQRKLFAGDSIFCFPCADGIAFTELRLERFFKRCWETANPSIAPGQLPDVRIYDLRHRFASAVLNRWLDEKRDLYAMLPYLRAYMGHDHMSETAYYIHILPENLVKSVGIDWAAFDALLPEVTSWQA
jgi:integrase